LEDTDNQNLENPDSQNRKVALVILLCVMIPLDFLIADPGRARAAAVCAGVFGTTIWTRRHLRRKVWFWVVLVLLAAAHVPLILFVRWSNVSMPPPVLLGAALVDFAYVCGPIWLIEEALSRDSKIS
jgi:hypothetical protein